MTALQDDPVLMVHAYVDGELDPMNARAVEQRLADDPALMAEYERVQALRQTIRDRLPPEAVPPELRRRIEAAARPPRALSSPSWRALAASIVATAFLASGSTWLALAPSPADNVETALVAGHIRALMAPQLVDVASSDRHTVKPWFNGRIPQAPRVVDLASQDFPLVGGRIDVVGRTPVPTLIYRHAKHVISLTAVPASAARGAAPAADQTAGYNVLHWTADGMAYWAVSDVAAASLARFAELFRTTPPDE
jgi:anti-sigma factor RsiW